jgi:hypothetical protein
VRLKDAASAPKLFIYSGRLSFGDASASIRGNSLSTDVEWNFSFVASLNFFDKKISPRLGLLLSFGCFSFSIAKPVSC